MQTVMRVKSSEIPQLVALLKTLFKNEEEVEIIVNPIAKEDGKKESRKEYWRRINKAIEDVENGGELISFTESEFEKYSEKLLSTKEN
jgi:hypothetical protein